MDALDSDRSVTGKLIGKLDRDVLAHVGKPIGASKHTNPQRIQLALSWQVCLQVGR